MNGKLITKVLLVALSLLLVVTAFTACGANKEEFETLKTEVDSVESQVNANTGKLETLETKKVVAELRALAEQIKLTADSAATQTALAEAIAKLEAADSTKATADALAAAKTALEKALKANADADAATKTALENAIASVKTTADAAATAAALESAKTALAAADTANATAAANALAAAKATLEAADTTNATAAADALAAAKAALEAADTTNATAAANALAAAKATLEAADTANATNAANDLAAAKAILDAVDAANALAATNALNAAKNELSALLEANTTADNATKTALEESIAALTGVVNANETDIEDKLQAAIDTLNAADTTVATNAAAALAADKTELLGLISANETLADSAIKEAKEELKGLLNNNAATDAQTKADLEEAIATLEATVGSNKEAAETALSDANTALRNLIADNKAEADNAIAEAKEELLGLIENNATTDAQTKADLEAAIAELNATVGSNKEKAEEALENTEATLRELIATNEAKADNAIAEAKEELLGLIENNATTDAQTKADLEEAIAALEATVGSNKEEADKALSDANTALRNLIADNKAEADNAIAEAKEELLGLIENNATTDAQTKADLEEAIAALEATVGSNKTEAASALATAQSALNATIEANKTLASTQLTTARGELAALIEANKTNNESLEGVVNTLEGVVNANEADIEAKLTAAKTEITSAYTAAISKVESTLSSAITDMDAAYKSADAAIEARLSTLESNYITLSGEVGALEEAVGEYTPSNPEQAQTIAEEITWIRAQLNTLGAEIQNRVADFVDGYELATKVLEGTATVEDFEGFSDKEEAYAKYSVYTLESFQEKVDLMTARAEWYEIDENVKKKYDDFVKTLKNVEFFLGRATTLETVESLFARFETSVNSLETLPELLDLQVKKIESGRLVTSNSSCYANAEEIWDKIAEINYDNDPDTYINIEAEVSGLTERYQNIVGACAKLAEAESAEGVGVVKTAIGNIPTPIVYNSTTPENNTYVDAARSAYNTFNSEYFSNETYNALYAEGVNAISVLTASEYEKLTNAETRVANLKLAAEATPAMIECVESFNTTRPVYSDFGAIDTLKGELEAWMNDNPVWGDLESENIDVMFGNANVALVTTAYNYAEAMNLVYTNKTVAGLNNAIITLNTASIGEGKIVLYEDYAISKQYKTALDDLILAINSFDATDSAADQDNNLHAMIAASDIDSFNTVLGQMNKLNTACALIRGTLADGETGDVAGVGGYFGELKAVEVDYYSLGTLNNIKGKVDAALRDANITEGDANYMLFANEVVSTYNTCIEKYNDITSRIVEIYKVVKATQNGEFGLSRGNEIITTNATVDQLVTELGVGNTDITLEVPVDGGAYETVNLKSILTEWETFVAKFKVDAKHAQEDAAAVNEAIADMLDEAGDGYLNPDDLNKREAILAVQKAYTDWAEKYLLEGETVEDIDEIEIYEPGASTPNKYVFVSVENYNGMEGAVAASDTRLAEAGTDFADVITAFDKVDAWTIYSNSDFLAADEAWNNYVNTYYVGGITANSNEGFHDEKTQKDDFDTDKAAFHAALTAVETNIADLVAAYTASKDLVADNLNNYDKITATYNELVEWAEANGIKAADAYVAEYKFFDVLSLENIRKLDSEETYKLVTDTEAKAIIDAKSVADTAMEEAANAFADVQKKFDKVASKWTLGVANDGTKWDIHSASAFAEANSAYTTYLTSYYGGAIATDVKGGIGHLEEKNAYDAMKTQEGLFNEFMGDESTSDTVIYRNKAINDLIAEVLATTISSDNASEVAIKIDSIRTMIGKFEEDYDCDKYTCTDADFSISEADQLNLTKAEVTADIMPEYVEAKAAAGADEVRLQMVEDKLSQFNSYLAGAVIDSETTLADAQAIVENAFDNAKASFDNYVVEWTTV